jgi:hypothetical protein
MTPVNFIEANRLYGAPPDLEESQCKTIHAHVGTVTNGSCEGSPMIVTAWTPDARELARLNAGEPIFLTFLSSGLPPHMVTTSFEEATKPA